MDLGNSLDHTRRFRTLLSLYKICKMTILLLMVNFFKSQSIGCLVGTNSYSVPIQTVLQ